MAIAAIGITADGRKHVLDFELGSSESTEVARDLMSRLTKNGFHCDRRLLAVLDGSAALRSAVKEFFPDAVVQRCLVHKERNIKSKLSKKHWSELSRLFRRLREVQGKDTALEVVNELRTFLKGKNAESLKSLEEAGEDLTALQSLNVPQHAPPKLVEYQRDRKLISQHSQQTGACHSLQGRDRPSHEMDGVRVAGG